MQIVFDCAGLTDIGYVRKNNEDQFLIADLNKSMRINQSSLPNKKYRLFGKASGKLLLVADGMGGHVAGEHASALTIDTIVHYVLNTMYWFLRIDEEDENDLEEELKSAVEKCQNMIYAAVKKNPNLKGMGTTLTMAYILWPSCYIVQVGDSRCYLNRNGQIKQLTIDQTLGQKLLEEGKMTPEQVRNNPFSRVLSSALGSETFAPDIYKVELQIEDTLMLCTDGVSGKLSEEQLCYILSKPKYSAEMLCHELVQSALSAGGEDNATTITCRFYPKKITNRVEK